MADMGKLSFELEDEKAKEEEERLKALAVGGLVKPIESVSDAIKSAAEDADLNLKQLSSGKPCQMIELQEDSEGREVLVEAVKIVLEQGPEKLGEESDKETAVECGNMPAEESTGDNKDTLAEELDCGRMPEETLEPEKEKEVSLKNEETTVETVDNEQDPEDAPETPITQVKEEKEASLKNEEISGETATIDQDVPETPLTKEEESQLIVSSILDNILENSFNLRLPPGPSEESEENVPLMEASELDQLYQKDSASISPGLEQMAEAMSKAVLEAFSPQQNSEAKDKVGSAEESGFISRVQSFVLDPEKLKALHPECHGPPVRPPRSPRPGSAAGSAQAKAAEKTLEAVPEKKEPIIGYSVVKKDRSRSREVTTPRSEIATPKLKREAATSIEEVAAANKSGHEETGEKQKERIDAVKEDIENAIEACNEEEDEASRDEVESGEGIIENEEVEHIYEKEPDKDDEHVYEKVSVRNGYMYLEEAVNRATPGPRLQPSGMASPPRPVRSKEIRGLRPQSKMFKLVMGRKREKCCLRA